MVALDFPNIEELKLTHYEAIEDYVSHMPETERNAIREHITPLLKIDNPSSDYEWLREFILADVKTLREWTTNQAEKLRFGEFKKLYLTMFSNGPTKYVDTKKTYNAYTLYKAMNIRVCPYCEHEYIDALNIEGKEHRTMEFDHFYPKDDTKYPGLAMCFYNLIPSCSSCNKIKRIVSLDANPYEEGIEDLTYLYPDIEIGVNIETLSEEECAVKFHPKGGMIQNEKALGLEQRYTSQNHIVKDLLKKKQQFPDEKLEKMEKAGFGTKEQLTRALFGAPRAEIKGKELHTKMKHDLIGY